MVAVPAGLKGVVTVVCNSALTLLEMVMVPLNVVGVVPRNRQSRCMLLGA